MSVALNFPGGHFEDRPEENLAGHAEDALTKTLARDPVEWSKSEYGRRTCINTHKN